MIDAADIAEGQELISVQDFCSYLERKGYPSDRCEVFCNLRSCPLRLIMPIRLFPAYFTLLIYGVSLCSLTCVFLLIYIVFSLIDLVSVSAWFFRTSSSACTISIQMEMTQRLRTSRSWQQQLMLRMQRRWKNLLTSLKNSLLRALLQR